MALCSMAKVAVLSNDLYRYVWDGKVQQAGIDPYRYAPDAPQLDRLHDSWLWPSGSVCGARGKPAGCTLLNRQNVHTIYPPGAQLYFRVVHLVVPESARDRGYELVGLLLAAVVTGVVLTWLVRQRRDARLIALWTLCPAVALEAVQNAHVDALAVVAGIAAIVVARRRVLWAATLIACAGLVKLYPLVLFPAVIQRRRYVSAAIVVALFVIAYLPYVVNVGAGVTGFLHGYLHQEGYGSGARFTLLRLVGLTGRPASVVAVLAVLAVLAAAAAGRFGSADRAAVIVFGALLFVASAGNPWYDLLLVALVAMTGAWQWLGVIAADYVGYLTSLLGGRSVALLEMSYGLAFAFLVVAAYARSRAHRQDRLSI